MWIRLGEHHHHWKKHPLVVDGTWVVPEALQELLKKHTWTWFVIGCMRRTFYCTHARSVAVTLCAVRQSRDVGAVLATFQRDLHANIKEGFTFELTVLQGTRKVVCGS